MEAVKSADYPPESQSPSPNPARVLLVEDNVNNRRIVQLLLQRLGIEPDVAEDGAAAVDAYKGKHYDLILMDIQMPNMDGLEASRRIRALEESQGRPHTPIMAVTANAMPEDRTACAAAGMDDFISKPVRKQSFLQAVDHWLHEEDEEFDADDTVKNPRGIMNQAAPPTIAATEPVVAENLEPPFDLSVLQRLANDVGDEIIPILLEGFEEDLHKQPDELQGLADSGDLETLTRVVHTIKGSAATFGANRLAGAAFAVETEAREVNMDAVRALLPTLLAEIEAAKPCIPKTI
jgi:CheY-like chemotaxis protein/HPt (histidine-containing phosphotransfer) domain-containing protein